MKENVAPPQEISFRKQHQRSQELYDDATDDDDYPNPPEHMRESIDPDKRDLAR